MLRSLIFIVCLLSFFSTSYGQVESTNKPQSYIFAEFETLSLSKIRQKMRALGAPIRQDKEAQAYIINYGSVEAMRRRRKALMTDRGYLEYDLSHVTFVDGSYRKNIKTIIWIVPKGAPIPTP